MIIVTATSTEIWPSFYNPVTGRFMSEDPIGFRSKQVNLYSYTLNSPLRLVDPYGKDVTVILYEGGTGHIGISVNDGPSVGYYGSYDDSSAALSGLDGEGSVRNDSSVQNGSSTQRLTIKTDASQDESVRSYFEELGKKPGKYNLYSNNCTTQANKALNSAGLEVPSGTFDFVPSVFFGHLKTVY